MYGTILVPTDDSGQSQRGVDHGLALAKALGSNVVIVTVTEPLTSYSGVSPGTFGFGSEIYDGFDEQQKKFAAGILDKAKEKADALGVPATVVHVLNAYASDAIVETAVARDAQLIVMASHGRRGLGRLLIGSQASAVVSHSPIPVLVVR